MKESQKAIKDLIDIIVELAEIVRELDPGQTRRYKFMEDKFESARKHLTQAAAFES